MRVCFFFLAALLVFGCASGNHLIGTWGDPNGTKYTEVIKADNTFTQDFPYMDSQIHIEGVWTYEGVHLHMEPRKADITGGAHPDLVRQMVGKTLMKPTDQDLDWQDNDKFFAKQPDGSLVLLGRKK